MNRESGDSVTPVRRSGRARKPNSRFADDEVEECYRKIVTGIGPSETPTTPSPIFGRSKKHVKKRDSHSEDKDETKREESENEKLLKSKPEFYSDLTQSQVYESLAKKAVTSSPSVVLVNGLEYDEILELSKKGKAAKKEEIVPTPKKRGRKKKVIKCEEEEPEENKSDQKIVSVISGSKDKDKNSNLEADNKFNFASSVMSESELFKDRNESEDSSSCSISDRLESSSSTNLKTEECVDDNSDSVKSDNSSQDKRLEIKGKLEHEPDIFADRPKPVIRTYRGKVPFKIGISAKTACLINGDISSENVPGSLPSESSSVSTEEGEKSGILTGGDSYSDSNSGNETKGKVRGVKSARGRRKQIRSDSTDSTDSDTPSPRRRGRSGRQVLSKGLGDNGKEISEHENKQTHSDEKITETKDGEPHETSQPPAQSSSKVQLLTAKIAHCLTKLEQSPAKESSSEATKEQGTPSKTVQTPPESSAVQPISIQSIKALVAKTSGLTNASPIKIKVITAKPKMVIPSDIPPKLSAKAVEQPQIKTPSEILESLVKGSLLSTKTTVPPTKPSQSAVAVKSLTAKSTESIKSEEGMQLPVKATGMKSSSENLSLPSKNTEPYEDESLPDKALESSYEGVSSTKTIKGVSSPTKALESSFEGVSSPAKALESCEGVSSSTKASDLSYEGVPVAAIATESSCGDMTLPVKPVESSHEVVSPTKAMEPTMAAESSGEEMSSPSKIMKSPTKSVDSSCKDVSSPTKAIESLYVGVSPTKAIKSIYEDVESSYKGEAVSSPAKSYESSIKLSDKTSKAIKSQTKEASIPVEYPESSTKAESPVKVGYSESPIKAAVEPVYPESPVKDAVVPVYSESPTKKASESFEYPESPTKKASAPVEYKKSPTKATGVPVLESPTKATPSPVPESPTKATPSPVPESPTKATPSPVPESPTKAQTHPSPSPKAGDSPDTVASPIEKFEPFPPRRVQFSPEFDIPLPPVSSPSPAKNMSPVKIPEPKINDCEKEDSAHNKSPVCFSTLDIPLPPGDIPLPPEPPRAESKLVETRKGKRVRRSRFEDRKSEVNTLGSSPEGQLSPQKKRRKDDFSVEQDINIPDYSEDDHKRKLSSDSIDKDNRKRRKVELEKSYFPSKTEVEQFATSSDLSATQISPQSEVNLSTNVEDKFYESNYSFMKNQKNCNENIERSEPHANFKLEDIKLPPSTGSPQKIPGLSPNISEEKLDHRDTNAVSAFMNISLPLGSSIPFISDHSGGSCEIPGLSIISSENSEYSQSASELNKASGGTMGIFAPMEKVGALGDKNYKEENSYEYLSKQAKVELESEAGVSGSRVEDIHMEEESTHDDTTVKVEDDKILDVKKEDHDFGSKVEEIKLTEEEIKERERLKQLELEEREKRNKEVVEQRLKSFTHLEENVYLGERRKTKRSKEVRRMLCDCTLTKEEIARGDVGCGDDCLNRLLMIECGSRCPLKDRCTNKSFQTRNYGDVEVFNADEKGCGLRARTSLASGTFIMEYIGEVFDSREFKRRRKEYARDHTAHFYFMALNSELLIDATRMGNISRFINHSCDPNAETQKWTVNGEVRIGFFTKTHIEAGEEINFDYRLERYGREPQKCYCGTSICRGWLGESPEEKTKEEKDEEKRKEERDRRKREERRASFYDDIDLEDEIEKLNSHKLRNRQDTLNLSRLLVRVEDYNGRLRLLDLLQTGEAACRRLFLDYHGLKVVWSLMADLSTSLEHTTLKIEILKTLECLPITNKTQLTDSRVLSVVERWSLQKAEITTISDSSVTEVPATKNELPMLPPSALTTDSDSNKKSSEESDSELDVKTNTSTSVIEASSADDSSLDSEADQSASQKQGVEEESSDSSQSDSKENSTTSNKENGKEEKEEDEKEKEVQDLPKLHDTMVALALKLLDTWKNLKEFFRIPKRERIELMKEHEREVDKGYKEYLDNAEDSDRDWERHRRERDGSSNRRDRRRRSPDRDRRGRNRKGRNSREDRSDPRMSKEKRRQLFEMKVQQEEEESKQRKMQEEMWAMHVDRCRLLGHDPYLTPIFDPTYQYYWDPVAANWQPYNGSGQSHAHGYTAQYNINIPVPAGYGQHKNDGEGGSPLTVLISGQTQGQSHVGLLPHESQVAPDDPLNPANIPLPGEILGLSQASPSQPPIEDTPSQEAKVLSIPLPGEIGTATTDIRQTSLDGEEEQPVPQPGPITIQLPPRWKIARDSQGHVYFYHVKTRASQWDPPSLDQHNQIQAELGSDSDSDSDSSSSDSSITSDSEDFSSEEEVEEVVETVTRSEVSDEKMIRRVKGKKRRSEALVQERVISPIMEIDREAARRERREAKERAREEARQERQERQEEQVARMEAPEGGETRTKETSSSSNSSSSNNINTTPSVLASVNSSSSRSKREKVKCKERAATAIADNSDAARKIKDSFRSRMATYIVSVLNPYRKIDCKEGKITCTEDFKYLARKLTHFVMVKELKQLHSIEALECSDSVKHKTKDFVRKYMSKYGSVFKRDPNDTKEY